MGDVASKSISFGLALVITDDGPVIEVYGDTGAHFSTHVRCDPLTAAEARELAAALTDAAKDEEDHDGAA